MSSGDDKAKGDDVRIEAGPYAFVQKPDGKFALPGGGQASEKWVRAWARRQGYDTYTVEGKVSYHGN